MCFYGIVVVDKQEGKTSKKERKMDKIVKNDGQGLVELLGLNEGTLKHQGNYYFIAVKDESRVDIYTEPTDESNDYIRVNAVYIDGEKYEFCEWCKELMPIDEMREEIQLGYLCNTCQKAIASRGESLTYKD